MDQTRLDAIRARCEAATKGPWKERAHVYGREVTTVIFDADWRAITLKPENSTFVAHARTDIPDLLAEVARLTADLDAMTAERDKLREQIDREEHEFEALITQREKERDAAQRRAEAAEKDIKDAISMSPYAICGLFCKNHKPGCGGKNCRPEWRGPDAQHDPDGGMGK